MTGLLVQPIEQGNQQLLNRGTGSRFVSYSLHMDVSDVDLMLQEFMVHLLRPALQHLVGPEHFCIDMLPSAQLL